MGSFCNILQWNCEGIRSKFTSGDIQQLIKETNMQCICLQETKLHPNAYFKIKGFKAYLQNLHIDEDQTPHGGVAIYVKSGISSYRVELQTPLQAVAVSIKCHKRITVCSLYLPPGGGRNDWFQSQDMQNLIDQLPKPFLILGDMNAHHPMWHDPRPVDDRGISLVDLITQNDIALLDRNKMTSMWKVDKTFSHIDLSLCSTELLSWFQWDVYDEPLNSDHFPVMLKSEIQKNIGGCEKWLLQKADWKKYQHSTETEEQCETFNSVHDAASYLENHIKKAASKTIPKSKGTGRRQSPPWWNGKCRAAIWKRKAAFKKYRRVTSRENFNKFSKARAEARKIVRLSKREAWKTFLDSINEKTSSKDIYRKFNMMNNRHKSELVNTLILNKEIKIDNVPITFKDVLIKELCELGCIQTLSEDPGNESVTTIRVRFETDQSRQKALELDGTQAGDYIITVSELVEDDGTGRNQPAVLDEPKDIADCLGRRFSFISSSSFGEPEFKEHKERVEREVLDFSSDIPLGYNSPLTLDELEYALNLSKDSAPGPDEVCYSMLKNLAPSGKMLLLELLNRAFKEGKFPDQWKEALVIPILKEGKPATNPSSYRPIALTSCICKVFERILNRRLVWFLESHGYIDRHQSGFRKGRSTLDSLAALAKEAQDAYKRGQYLFCIFFDLEKAYDTCWKHLIMKELHNFGLRGELPKLIEDFLSGRSFKVKVGKSMSDPFQQEMGVPQGGVLSCTLFSLAINTVVRVIRGLVSYSLYVDDMRISYAYSDPELCRRRIQPLLDALHRWSLQTGFRFSIGKTQWMAFHRTKDFMGIEFTLGGKVLKQVFSKKFLGLIFDRRLTWKDQLEAVRGDCMRILNVLSLISYKSAGTDSKTLLRVYRTVVRSKLDYGCQVYGTAPKTYLHDKLDPVHHKGLRLGLGAYRTSPAQSLYVEAGEPDLKCRREMLQLQYYARLKQILPDRQPVRLDDTSLDDLYAKKSNRPITLGYKVRQLKKDMNIEFPHIELLRESRLGPWERRKLTVCMDLSVHMKATTSPDEYMQYFLEHKHKTDVDLYTDGSKNSSGVGAGAAVLSKYIGNRRLHRRLHESASIFTAELYAIKLALISLKTSQGVTCAVYSDSRSAIQAIKGQSSSKLVLDIEELVALLSAKKIKITFCWVPGHAGIQGNELADKVAKLAVGQRFISTQDKVTLCSLLVNYVLTEDDRVQLSSDDIPVSDVKTYIKRKVFQYFTLRWERKTVAQVKLREVKPTFTRSPDDFGLNRRDAWKVTRLRIGHTRLTHSYMLAGEDMPLCIACNRRVTVQHILMDCGNNARVRLKHFDHRTVTFSDLLSKKEYITKVLAFLKEINLYKEL